MTIEVNEHDAWTLNYLVDRLKQHLATFEIPVAPNNDERIRQQKILSTSTSITLFWSAKTCT